MIQLSGAPMKIQRTEEFLAQDFHRKTIHHARGTFPSQIPTQPKVKDVDIVRG